MRKLLPTIIFVIIISNIALAGSYSGGSGTAEDPYQIGTVKDLLELSKTQDDWSSSFIMIADIEFNEDETQVDWNNDGVVDWNSEDSLGFSPIGDGITKFTGNFDGEEFWISNLYINRTNFDYNGLFGYTYRATIENVGLIDLDFNCRHNAGGLIGYDISGKIRKCYTTGIINAQNNVGGLIGKCESSSIIKCFSKVIVNADTDIGGFIGVSYSSNIANSYYIGEVIGDSVIGGLIGKCSFGFVKYCYSSGKTHGDSYNSGFVGYDQKCTYNNNFCDKSVNSKQSLRASAKTTAEMKTKSTFTDAGWDFVNIWNIDGVTNDGYPFFKGMNVGVPEEINVPESNCFVYPNPAGDRITLDIDLKNGKDVTIILYDLFGNETKTLYHGTYQYSFTFNTEDLTPGTYQLVVKSDGSIENVKLVIVR